VIISRFLSRLYRTSTQGSSIVDVHDTKGVAAWIVQGLWVQDLRHRALRRTSTPQICRWRATDTRFGHGVAPFPNHARQPRSSNGLTEYESTYRGLSLHGICLLAFEIGKPASSCLMNHHLHSTSASATCPYPRLGAFGSSKPQRSYL
jgi:hypothetical protein